MGLQHLDETLSGAQLLGARSISKGVNVCLNDQNLNILGSGRIDNRLDQIVRSLLDGNRFLSAAELRSLLSCLGIHHFLAVHRFGAIRAPLALLV